jgi:hypothetical protein
MSDFNKIMAYDSISPYIKEEHRQQILEDLGMNLDTINDRLGGKRKEEEFLVILLIMNICKRISAFDEGVSQLLETATADLLIELYNEDKFLLEIKHTDRDEFKISGGNLNKRIEFANSNNLDLYFAISIKGFWMLFKSDYLINKKGKIDKSDYVNSQLDKIGCITYLFPKDIKIKSVYSKTNNKSTGLLSREYGNLTSYEFYYKNKKIFRVKGQKSPFLAACIALDALREGMHSEKYDIVQYDDITIITVQTVENYFLIPEYDFLLLPIRRMLLDNDMECSIHDFIELKKAGEDLPFLNPDNIRSVMNYLANNGVDILYVFDKKLNKI